jgi:cytochrome c-type biogenesis protein CcsB
MAKLSLYLFTSGAVFVLVSFVLHVVHTTVLASVRAGLSVVRAPRLAGAATGAGGSVESTTVGGGPRGATPPNHAIGSSIGSSASRVAGLAIASGWIATVLLGLSMLVRAVIVGRGPWGSMFEFSVAFAFMILAAYLLLERRYPIRSLGFVATGVSLFLAAYAWSLLLTLSAQASGYEPTFEPLVPALNNAPLLTIHVAAMMISYGVMATSFAAAVGYLAQGRDNRLAWLPSRDTLDEVAYRAVIIGFPILAIGIILGAWWASIAWGRYWGWDPKETSILVTWLLYAVYLHMHSRRSLAGRPAAAMLLVAFGAIMFTFFGNLFFSGLHAYSGL